MVDFSRVVTDLCTILFSCYGVECACTKTTCPVLRLQKKVSDGHPVAK